MIIALALVFSVNANAKTNWIMENSYFMDCGEIGDDGQKTLEMWECDHQQNLLRKEWYDNAGLGKLIK